MAYGVARPNILLGRDFLSNLVLAFDGRRQVSMIADGSAMKSMLLRLMAIS